MARLPALALPVLLSPALWAQDPIYRLPGIFSVAQPRIAALGDFDGDGRDDFSLSHALTSASRDNLVVVSGRDGTKLAGFGDSATAIGDLDGDGQWEVVHAAAVYNAAPVSVRSTAGVELFEIPVPTGSRSFGVTVRILGDWDGDGIRDLGIGAPFEHNPASEGLVYVHSGADGAFLHVLEPEVPYSGFGSDLDPIADVNGDGTDDVVVGQQGYVHLYAGGSGDFLRTLGDPDPRGYFGWTLDVAGDADGDGIEDVAANAYMPTLAGTYVSLCSGRTGEVLHTFRGPLGTSFGWDVAGVGDVDGDARADVAIGVPHSARAGETRPGEVLVFSGADGRLLLAAAGTEPGDGFGWTVGRVGDANGDGTPDFAAGWYRKSGAAVMSGRPLGLVSDRNVLAAAVGGSVQLSLRAGPLLAGGAYLVLGSASDTAPGFSIGGVAVPLNPDAYLAATAMLANGAAFVQTLGVLDSSGRASARLVFPALPAARGLRLDHAWIAADASGALRVASNAVPLVLQ
jgi:hypothetical protein